jgi:hypothetical protein
MRQAMVTRGQFAMDFWITYSRTAYVYGKLKENTKKT